MTHPAFFKKHGPFSLGMLAEMLALEVDKAHADHVVQDIAPLDLAGEGALSFFDNPRYKKDLVDTKATAVILAAKHRDFLPAGVSALVAPQPYHAYAHACALFYPDAAVLKGIYHSEVQMSETARVHPEANLEDNVIVEPGAVIGSGASIGSGTVISANAVIGGNCQIGRNCYIGANASVMHAFLGNQVIVHPGVRIGQDGFGFAMGAGGHIKVPQVGRVIIQDRVEIGANTTIDRGANRDTIIGEGTKVDNLVQIGHNVQIGCHCVIVGQTGISGSTVLEDYVVLGGQVGTVGHIRIGMGAQIAGSSNVKDNVPAGAKWGGTPAKPAREWFREMTAVKNLAKNKTKD